LHPCHTQPKSSDEERGAQERDKPGGSIPTAVAAYCSAYRQSNAKCKPSGNEREPNGPACHGKCPQRRFSQNCGQARAPKSSKQRRTERVANRPHDWRHRSGQLRERLSLPLPVGIEVEPLRGKPRHRITQIVGIGP